MSIYKKYVPFIITIIFHDMIYRHIKESNLIERLKKDTELKEVKLNNEIKKNECYEENISNQNKVHCMMAMVD